MLHKIVLNGFGRIGRIIHAGANSLTVANVKQKNLNSDLSFLTYKINNKILVDSYRKMQRKYFPEKDIYKG